MTRTSLTRARRAAAVAVLLPLAPAALASGTGENLLLIIDPGSPESLYLGNYYRHARNIPDSNVLYLNPHAPGYAEFVANVQPAVLGAYWGRDIDDHTDFILVAPGIRHAVTNATDDTFYIAAPGLVEDNCSPVTRFAVGSVFTMSFISDEVLAGGRQNRPNRYFANNDTPLYFDSSRRYYSGAFSADPDARSYFIGGLLAYSGTRGNTTAQILDMIDRSVAADGSFPAGTFYFMETADDVRSDPRDGKFNAAVASISALGGTAEKLFDDLPYGRHDCLGIMTGFAATDILGADLTILPGAFADHLTSFASTFDTASQVKSSRWITKGASGTSGTVEEPCNYPGKFPHPRLHVWYFQGLTLGEAWLRSLTWVPFQQLFTGDPLTRPFAHIPAVDVPDAPSDPVSGFVSLSPVASTTHPTAVVNAFELHLDGRRIDTCAIGGTLDFDTSALAEGWHDLRVLAFDNSSVRSVGAWRSAIIVDNSPHAAELSAPVTSGNRFTAFTFDASASGGDPVEVRLIQNGRVVAAAPSAPASITVFGQTLGAGPSTVRAEIDFADGTTAVSAPVPVSISYTGGSSSGAAPVAFDYSVTIPDNVASTIVLPATFDDDPSLATYAIVSPPAQGTLLATAPGAFRVLQPHPGAAGADSLSFSVTTAAGTSNVAVITINYVPGPPIGCPADLDGNGVVDSIDFLYFLTLFNLGDPLADWNDDGSVNTLDFLAFLNDFSAGC